MGKISEFMKVWDETKDVSVLLDKGITLPNTDDIRTQISSLPLDEQTRIQSALSEALVQLISLTEKLEKEQAALKVQMENVGKSAEALVAYKAAERTGKSGKLDARKKEDE